MLYRVYTPTPELADIVASYWYAAIPPNSCYTQQYHTPLFEGMVFNFTRLKEYLQYDGNTACVTKTAYLFGQRESHTAMSGAHKHGGYIIGVRFKPLGLAKITGTNLNHYLIDCFVDAEDIWGNELKLLCEEMQEADCIKASVSVLERFLTARRRAIRLHDRVKDVEQAISLMGAYRGNISCKMLQDLTNTGRKTLERAFMTFHGMQPKAYNRIIRFNAAKKMIDTSLHPNLTELAHHLGYFDQSHFIRDFKKFAGQTPTLYLKTVEEERMKRTIPVD